MRIQTVLLLACCFAVGAPSIAQAAAKPTPKPTAVPHKAAPNPEERSSVTHHTITVNGASLSYTATAGTLILKNDKDEPQVSVFYVAYTKDGDHAQRPVTFLYNGGPGAASEPIHMAAFGPRRVALPNAAPAGSAPYRLVDNQYTLLTTSDLVFIDAPGTGYSKLLPKADSKDFYGIDQDAAAFGHFIERYITLNDRWASPKYLLGESYGTTRSAAVVDYLQNRGMTFNGVTLLSSVLDFGTIDPGPGADLGYVTYLPSEAAVNWYHDKSANKPSLQSVIEDARTFANGEYATALMQGDRISKTEFTSVAMRLSKLLGLSEHYVELSNLRVSPDRFEKELKRDSSEQIGRLDARYVGYDLDTLGEGSDYDPADSQISGALNAGFLSYVRDELNWKSEDTYLPISDKVNSGWDFTRKSIDPWIPPTVTPDLREALTTNPSLRVFDAAGRFDLATPFGAAEWTFSHMGLTPELRSHVQIGYYDSGHMVYLNEEALAKFRADLTKFYADTQH